MYFIKVYELYIRCIYNIYVEPALELGTFNELSHSMNITINSQGDLWLLQNLTVNRDD